MNLKERGLCAPLLKSFLEAQQMKISKLISEWKSAIKESKWNPDFTFDKEMPKDYYYYFKDHNDPKNEGEARKKFVEEILQIVAPKNLYKKVRTDNKASSDYLAFEATALDPKMSNKFLPIAGHIRFISDLNVEINLNGMGRTFETAVIERDESGKEEIIRFKEKGEITKEIKNFFGNLLSRK